MRNLWFLFLIFSATICRGAAYEVASPSGNIMMAVEVASNGAVSYRVFAYDGKELVKSSTLGIAASNWSLQPSGEPIVSTDTHNEVWTQPWGENKTCLNHYNELTLTAHGNGSITYRFRAFDDGVAFRYELNAPVDQLVITDEQSQFNLSGSGTSWSIPGSFETYELQYREIPVAEVENTNTPFTFASADGSVYASIHEAALYDYPEMILRRGDDGILRSDLAPLPDGVKAYVPGKFNTPWRTIQIGRRPVDLINSCMILNLNEPSRIADTSWIKPQKYVGIWWGMHLGTQTWVMGPRHGATTRNAIDYIDFAVANNIQGVLFEGWNEGWENWGGNQHFDYTKAYADFDIDSIARYAANRGIELWMHDETGGNIPEFEAVLDSAFAYYASLGVHTVKTGYAGGFKGGYFHHSQYGVRHYQKVVETAAKYHIMIDAHEPIKETGIRRTWPNMMTREGARGMEWNAWSEGNSATYLCTLPFVRLLSGPMDYTPGIFDIDYNRAKADPGRLEWNGPNGHTCIKTTLARQIANWVIIYSPLQMAADQIENYRGHPAFQFFRDFDADCSWSKALDGEIGRYIVVARKAGDRYFIGAGTDDQARKIQVSLDFLEPGVEYQAAIYADMLGSRDKVVISYRKVTSADSLTIEMQATGGQAISLIPVK